MKVIVIILAAGMGSRMGSPVNKQYLRLGDRPILAHTVALFQQHPMVEQILIVTPAAEIPYCRAEVVERFDFDKVVEIVPGGEERQDSVRLGLRACVAADDDVVLIHDGVRPLLPASLVEPLIVAARESGAAILAVPVKDTVKEVEQGLIVETPERSRLWQAQTPQAFRFGLIRRAHERALDEGRRGTDDASLIERLGLPVRVLSGSYRNIKITTPEDLVLAEALHRAGGGGA